MIVYLDGKFLDSTEAKVSVFDHGLLYGDGIFEGIRIYGGNIFRLDDHLERLEMSAKAIMLAMPLDRAAMAEAAGVMISPFCTMNTLSAVHSAT